MSLRKTALAGVFWTFLQQFSTQIIAFGVSVILARLLLPAEFGLIGMIAIFMGIGRTLVDSGLSESLIRTRDADEIDFSTVFWFNLTVSILIYILIFFSAPLIAVFFKQEILIAIIRAYCLSFIISAFSTIQITRLTKKMNFKVQMMVALPSILVGGVVGVTMAYTGYGVWSLVWSALSQSLVASTQYWFVSGWRPKFIFSTSRFKKHFGFGVKLLASGILNQFYSNIYAIIIGKYFSAAQVGFYQRADSVKQLPVSNLSAVLSRVTYPLFSSIQDDDIRLKQVYSKIMQMVLFVIAPTLIFLAVLAEPLFRFLFTEKWLPAVPYFRILCINGILYPIHSYNLNMLNVKGRSDLFLRLEIIKRINLTFLLFIGFQWGVYGLLYAGVLSSVISFFINTHYTGKFINYTSWQQTKDISPYLFLGLGIGLIIYGIDEYLKTYEAIDFVRLSLGISVGTLLYFGASQFLRLTAYTELLLLIKRK